MSRPDFICIGPPKTGTTWLFEVLKDHPGVWLPPVKEVQYFWGFGKRNNLPSGFLKRVFRTWFGYPNKKWKNQYYRKRIKFYAEKPNQINFKNLYWDFFYLYFPQSPWWYRSLFPNKEGLITGDISPTYSLLTSQEIKRMASFYPDMKIVIT